MTCMEKMECTLTELRACAPVFVRLADELEDIARQMQAYAPDIEQTYRYPEEPAPMPAFPESKAPAKPETPPKPAITLDQLRTLLARKSVAGNTDAVKALLLKYGAARLSELPEFNYADVYEEAEVLPDAP